MRSVDGTVKYLVLYALKVITLNPYIFPMTDRATLCVSSQVGCKMNCKFCMTGKQGYTNSLTAAQISESDLFDSGTGYADQRGIYGHGRTVR